jgi:enamine deaminase RidA (YjgF/YER057c/UK114 family)
MRPYHAALIITLTTAGILLAAGPASKAKKQFLNPQGVPKPTGYTQVVSSGPGRMIFISGQGGAAPDGQMPEDFAEQTKNTFENIGRCLKAAGGTFNDIVKINYYVTDMAYTAELRRIRAGYLNQSAPPASTLVQAGLGKGLKVEIEVVAIVAE